MPGPHCDGLELSTSTPKAEMKEIDTQGEEAIGAKIKVCGVCIGCLFSNS